MLSHYILLSMRAENLKICFTGEELMILAELSKQYIISKDSQNLVLQGNFSKESVTHVLEQLGVEDNFEIICFPHSASTTIKFN